MKTLERRALARALGVSVLNVEADEMPGLPPELAALEVPCCMGAAVYGLGRCTCWEPIYAETQIDELADATPAVRAACCHDCAYRNGSPEREQGLGDELSDIAGTMGETFVCHHGENGVTMRRVVAWRHPLVDGIVAAGDGDYRPPTDGRRGWLSDGTVAPVCAGYAARRRALLGADAC